MDFRLQIGKLLAIFGVHLSNCFIWPSVVMCITMGYLFHVWGGVGVGLFCVVISICTELLCFGRGIEQLAPINCFWNIWAALKRAYGGSETHPDWLATEEAAAVQVVLWW